VRLVLLIAVAGLAAGCTGLISPGVRDARQDIANRTPRYVFVGDADPAAGDVDVDTGWRLRAIGARVTDENAAYMWDYNHTVAEARESGELPASRHLHQLLSLDELERARRTRPIRAVGVRTEEGRFADGQVTLRMEPNPLSAIELNQLLIRTGPDHPWRVVVIGVPDSEVEVTELHDGGTLIVYSQAVTPVYFVIDTKDGILVRRSKTRGRRDR
jgi:hypothetical protein